MEDKIKAITTVLVLIAALITSPLWTLLLHKDEPKIPENSPPIAIDVSSNASNLIYIGSSIKFVARAKDDDDDPIDYKFLLKGPSTDNLWKKVQDWSKSDNWIWHINPCYSDGNYVVQVLIRDKKHSMSAEGDDPNPKNINLDIKLNNCPAIQKIEFSNAITFIPEGYYDSKIVRAIANDPEGDPILYKFSIKGPATDNNWETVLDWQEYPEMIWFLNNENIGLNTIKVEVKDNKEHCDKCNMYHVKDYTIPYHVHGLDKLFDQERPRYRYLVVGRSVM
jgi:hypothetical protein